MDNPQDQLVSTDIRLDLHMSKVGQSQLHLAGAKPKWALARGDYITTSTITEHGFGVYSFYLNPGDFLLLVISPPTHTFFFSRKSFLIPVHSFMQQIFTMHGTTMCHSCSKYCGHLMNKTDNNA